MTTCEFCELEAVDIANPPMCEKHLVVALATARMRRWWGQESVAVDQVVGYLTFNPMPDFDLDEVPALCAQMPEFQLGVS